MNVYLYMEKLHLVVQASQARLAPEKTTFPFPAILQQSYSSVFLRALIIMCKCLIPVFSFCLLPSIGLQVP